METYKELMSLIKNMEYYNNEIGKLIQRQGNLDIEKNVDTNEMKIRFECIGTCWSNKEWIESYIQNTKINLEEANELDKELTEAVSEHLEQERQGQQ